MESVGGGGGLGRESDRSICLPVTIETGISMVARQWIACDVFVFQKTDLAVISDP